MLFFLILYVKVIFLIKQSSADCVPRCETIKMTDSIVPTQFNRCICELIVENGDLENLSNQELKCVPSYRSLKFRDRATGAVVLHKAVVGFCSGLNSREYVNQSKFDGEEQEFRENRNYRVASSPIQDVDIPQRNSWIDGFRNNIMQLYRKPDGHLRFG